MLRRLSPDALAPGHTELVGGAAHFHTEIGELPYLASNWSAEDPALALPAWRIVETDTARIGVVAVLDPRLMIDIPRLAVEGITITDPVSAVQAVVDEMYALPNPPESIIALTTASSEVMANLRRRGLACTGCLAHSRFLRHTAVESGGVVGDDL